MTAPVALAITIVVASLTSGLGQESTGSTFAQAAFPAAMVALPEGGLLYAERLTGRVRRVDADGRVVPSPVATVETSTRGQRGLLGLAVAPDGRVFAAWTSSPVAA